MTGNRTTGPLNDSHHAQSHYDRAGAELSRRHQLDLVIPSDISQLTEHHQRQPASEAARLIDYCSSPRLSGQMSTSPQVRLWTCLSALAEENGKIKKMTFVFRKPN